MVGVRKVMNEIEDPARRRRFFRASCQGKEAYDSRSVAEQVARRRHNNTAYKCECCGAWHVGTKK